MTMERVCCTLLVAFLFTAAQAQDLGTAWLTTMGSTGVDRGTAITVDDNGHVYLAGSFTGTVDFDPGPGVESRTSAGGNDIYVAKLTAAGELVWVSTMGGANSDSPTSIAVDAQGNVYTTGGFCGTADFDPGPGSFTMTAATTGQADIFVSKLDADGNFVWAKGVIGGTWWDQGYGIAIDPAGNVVVAGRFYAQGGPRDFDPGPGTYFLTAGHEDIFVLKLDADGNFIWAVGFGTAPHESRAYSVAVDDDGNIYTTGYFRGAVDFDPDEEDEFIMTSVGTWNIFYHKLDPDGNFVWARSLPISTTTYHTEPRGYGRKIILDQQGHLLATGRFSGTVDFDPGPGTTSLTAAGDHDIYVLKMTTDGDLVWARSMGGSGYDEGFGIGVDADGGVHVVGMFRATADLDPGAEVFEVVSAGGDDMFVLHLDEDGDLVQAGAMGGIGEDQANAVVLDADGEVYIAGWFSNTVDFDPGPVVLNATSKGNMDIFLLKLGEPDRTGIHGPHVPGIGELRVHPNPAGDRITLQPGVDLAGKRYAIAIYDAQGALVHDAMSTVWGPMLSLELPPACGAGPYHVVLYAEGLAPMSARVVVQR